MSFRLVSITALLLSLALLGCGPKAVSTGTGNKENKNQQADNNDTEAPLQYPEIYTNEKLPQFDKATLTSTGRQTQSLKDGIALDLTSTESVQTVAKFYEKELNNLGWKVPVPKLRTELTFVAECTKDNLKYIITITKMPDGKSSKIHISFLSN